MEAACRPLGEGVRIRTVQHATHAGQRGAAGAL